MTCPITYLPLFSLSHFLTFSLSFAFSPPCRIVSHLDINATDKKFGHTSKQIPKLIPGVQCLQSEQISEPVFAHRPNKSLLPREDGTYSTRLRCPQKMYSSTAHDQCPSTTYSCQGPNFFPSSISPLHQHIPSLSSPS